MTSTTPSEPGRRRALTIIGVVAGVLILGLVALLTVDGLATTTTHRIDPVTAEAVVLDLTASGAVDVVGTDEDQVSVEVRVRDPLGLVSEDQRLEGERLILESSCTDFWIDFFNPCLVDYVVRVPTSTEISGRARNAAVDVVGLEADVNLSNRNGSMTVEDIEGLVRLETRNGAIDVSEVAGELFLDTRNGSITVSDSTSAGTVEVITSNGSIELTDVSGEEMTLLTNNGRIDVIDGSAPRVTARTNNSSVTMGFSTAPDYLDAETDNGDIEIVLPADAPAYAVEATTSNGSTDTSDIVADPDSAFTIDATTDNGSIRISRDAS